MAVSKKQQILDTALELFVAQGIHSTSTASIAKASGVANGTLFHHFPSKEELVISLYQTVKQDFAREVAPNTIDQGDIKQQAKSTWDKALDWTIANPLRQQFCLQAAHYQPLSCQLQAKVLAEEFGFLKNLITYGQQQKLIANYPLDLMLDHCHGQFLTSSSFFINRPELADNQEYRDAAFEIFWRALKA